MNEMKSEQKENTDTNLVSKSPAKKHIKRFTGEYAIFFKVKKPLRCIICSKVLRDLPHRKTQFCSGCYEKGRRNRN